MVPCLFTTARHTLQLVCMPLQFYDTPNSVKCAEGFGPSEVSPISWNAAGAPYGSHRAFARCNNTMPATRFVTLQFWKATYGVFSLGEVQVLQDSEYSLAVADLGSVETRRAPNCRCKVETEPVRANRPTCFALCLPAHRLALGSTCAQWPAGGPACMHEWQN